MTIQNGLLKTLVCVLFVHSAVWAQSGPQLILPENGSSDVPWETTSFNWSMVDSAVVYQIEIDNKGDFESPFYMEFSENNFTDVSELYSSWQFNWRVRAGFASDTAEYRYSEWSEVYTFNTQFIAPQNTVPPDSGLGEDYSNVQLEWQLDLDPLIPSEQNFYAIEIAADQGFSNIFHQQSDINNSSTSVSDLEPGTRYFFHVKYYNLYGESPWSETSSFVTMPLDLEQVVLVSPENHMDNINPANIIFSWEEVQNAESYNIELAQDSLFSEIVDASLVFSTEYMTNISLFDTRIFWRVQAGNTDGDGPWSEVWSFNTSITAPQTPPALLSPVDSSAGYSAGNLEFEWRGVQGAESYTIEVSNNSLFTDFLISETAFDSSITLDLDLADGNYYYWRVMAQNDSGAGPWSDTWSFYAGTISNINGIANVVNSFDLKQNYPNPFNPSTTIEYQLAASARVQLKIFNVLGQHIITLVNQEKSSGIYKVSWDGLNSYGQTTASGVYIYILEATSSNGQKVVKSNKMIKLM
jgi:FlgD Ig-like domain/Fibronectin type III domain